MDEGGGGRLFASSRLRRERDDEQDEVAEPARPAPGKRTAVADVDEPDARPWFPDAAARVDRFTDDDSSDVDLAGALAIIADARGGHPLPAALRVRLERTLGVALGEVRLHDDARAHAAAAAIKARAFTIGSDIYFARGAYQPESATGVELIAHEVAHVAQQARGTAPSGRGVSQPSDRHEREAEGFARKFLEEQLENGVGTAKAYTDQGAQLVRELMAAGALVIGEVIGLADPSPKRDHLLAELEQVRRSARGPAAREVGLATLPISRSDAVHRDAKDDEDDASNQDKRFEYFSKNAPIEDFPKTWKPTGEDYFAFVNPSTGHRYKQSSPEPWKREDYLKVLKKPGAGKPPKVSERTATKDVADLTTEANKKKYGIANVTDFTWAFLRSGSWQTKVEDIRPSVRKIAKPEEQFECYFNVIKVLKKKERLVEFEWNGNDIDTYKQNVNTHSASEATSYRKALRTALVAAYGNDWDAFYKEVMQGKAPGGGRLIPPNFNGLTGSIFEEMLRKDTGLALDNVRPIFDTSKEKNPKKKLTNSPRAGDNCKGTLLIDNKASEAGIDKVQCEDYRRIVRLQIPGYVKNDEDENEPARYFEKHVYPTAGDAIATTVQNQINLWYTDPADREVFEVTPSAAKLKKLIARFNPQVEFTAPATAHSPYTFKKPDHALSGVKISSAKFVTAADDTVTGGTIDMHVDMGKGAFKNEPEPRKINPGSGREGTVDKKFGGFKSTLDKVLGKVDVDATIVEGGVEADVSLKKGVELKIPGFSVTKAALKARYVNDTLSVKGEVGVLHDSKKIEGSISVGWDGAGWTFDGKVTLHEGLVPGLSEVELGVRYAAGKTEIYSGNEVVYNRKVGAIDLTGKVRGLLFDVNARAFSGEAEIIADLGMFGKASATATLERNQLTNASFSYDSPELKYPKTGTPVLTGTVGGTLNYNAGKWSGRIRGSANVDVAGLKKVAKDGVGVDVDAHINADGTYGGTVSTNTTLTFGKHVSIPPISATLKDDGTIEGDFEIKIHKLKWIDAVSVKCHWSPKGITITNFHLEKAFEMGKFSGSVKIDYDEATGLVIGGKVKYEIKPGMVAVGDLVYHRNEGTFTLTLGMEKPVEILKVPEFNKTLFKIQKQIPIPIVAGVAGAYIDIGFDLSFKMGFDLGFQPTFVIDSMNMETGDFKKIDAKLKLLGLLYAELIGTPIIGAGVYVGWPELLRGGGGLKMPVTARGEIVPEATIDVGYKPDGTLTTGAEFDLSMNFGIKAELIPFAQFSVLWGLWEPTWSPSTPIAAFDILKKKELFKLHVNLGDDMTTKKDPPPLPAENAAPDAAGEGDPRFKQKDSGTKEKDPKPDKTKQGPTNEVAESGDEGPFSLKGLLEKLKQSVPAVATLEKWVNVGIKVWKVVEPFWLIFKPFIKAIGDRVEEFIDLFTTDLPSSSGEVMSWLWKLAKALFKLAFGNIWALADAIKTLVSDAIDIATSLLTKAIEDGHIGCRRHYYFIPTPWPFDNIEFLAAAEWKCNIPGFVDLGYHEPPSHLIRPSSAVGLVLYEALVVSPVPYTNTERSPSGDAWDDFWRGPGAPR
ncbi:MAG TPA: DUF4157 domain-containing protein [Kofleriaceae bacterium]|nr:DUF4157 domain-containing protein [Kofleriaceae bacterium]